MDIKARLENHRNLLLSIRSAEQQLLMVEESMCAPQTTDPSRISVQGGESPDFLSQKMHHADTYRRELMELYSRRDQNHGDLWSTINQLSNVNEITSLKAKYFDLLSRDDAAQLIFGVQDDFQSRRSHYLKRTTRLHTQGIINLRKLECG
ncbi:MAG: hypothetical protein FWE46_03785 [Coriobacteriia bacterium]|nr:hypothetical protein [Coriobacteriia bacterium]MCL2537398.1 hypothetical protein [Coriobacteriia bacterium]